MFYVIDEGPLRHYPTLAEAVEDANENISLYRKECDPEWPCGVEDIAIYECDFETDEPAEDGKCVMVAAMVDERPPLEGEDQSVDFYCDYQMKEPTSCA